MQKHRCYSVYDVKAQAYLVPFYHATDGSAVRVFANTMTDREHPFRKNPEDFTLFHLGEFNDQNGEFEGLVTPQPLAKGIELLQLIEQKENENGQS